MIEILAPAGNKESFLAAIHNGANAVYLGLKQFNARENASNNFTMEELAAIVSYAHVFNVKVYLTINTLIKEEEINELIKIVYDANTIGVNAFIVQDIGVASFIHKIFPSIELHASTQMGIHNVQGARMAQKLGVKRIVLSRETSLEDIAKIKKQTDMELEFFVQGALCVAFSGNCSLSQSLTGKSANRGLCAQPCRHFYSAEQNGKTIKEGFLLSAKDISLVSRMKDLVDAGITSFKIEGRARRAGYVAETVKVFSDVVKNNYEVSAQQIEELKQVFNRGGFCEAYLDGEKGNIIHPLATGNIGIGVGKVINFTAGNKFNVIRVSSAFQLGKGDGLKFLRNGMEVASAGVFDIQQTRPNEFSFTTTAVVKENDEVRLISQASKEEQALLRRKKLAVLGICEAKINEKPTLTIEFQKFRVKVEGEEVAHEAINHSITEEEIVQQITKTGNEMFSFLSVRVDMENVFLRKMQINDLRRKGLLALTKAISDDYLKQNRKDLGLYRTYETEVNKYKKKVDGRYLLVNVSCEEQLSPELVNNSTSIAFNPPIFQSEVVKSFVAKVKSINAEKTVYLYLPAFATNADVAVIDKIVAGIKGLGVVANNLYGLAYVLSGCPVIAGPQLNIYNSRAVDFTEGFGVSCNVVSPELPESEVLRQNSYATAHCLHFAFGKEVLMNLVHCPIKSMTGCTCETCKYSGNYDLVHEKSEKFSVQRTKIGSCTFSLSTVRKMPKGLFGLDTNLFIDFTGLSKVLVDAVVSKLMIPVQYIDEN